METFFEQACQFSSYAWKINTFIRSRGFLLFKYSFQWFICFFTLHFGKRAQTQGPGVIGSPQVYSTTNNVLCKFMKVMEPMNNEYNYCFHITLLIKLPLSLFGPYMLYDVSTLHLPQPAPNRISCLLPCSLLSESSSCQVEESITWTGGKAELMCECACMHVCVPVDASWLWAIWHSDGGRIWTNDLPQASQRPNQACFWSFPLYSQQTLYTKTIK